MVEAAQVWFDREINKNTTTGIKQFGSLGANDKQNPYATDKLTGTLNIIGCKVIEKIDLSDNEIEEVVIEDCPNLKIIDFDKNKIKKIEINKIKIVPDGSPTDNDLVFIKLGNNQLKELDFSYCKKVKHLYIQDNPDLRAMKNLDYLRKVEILNTDGDRIVPSHTSKVDYWEGLEDVLKKVIGESSLPKNGSGGLDKSSLENKIKVSADSQAISDKNQAEKKAKEAEDELEGVKDERDQLKQQWEAIRKELGLGDNANQQQIITKIKELKGRPTTSCTHTDYDSIKSERDSLKSELETKKRRISELESNKNNDDNKENTNIITKKVLVDTTNTNWKNWGIELSDEQKNKISSASSAKEVETARNEIIKTEFSKLKDENGSSAKLSIGLGLLAIGSLLVLAWVLMKQNNLPKTEPEKPKER